MQNNITQSRNILIILMLICASTCALKPITMTCTKYVGDLKCRVPHNIYSNDPVTVTEMESETLARREIAMSKTVVISYTEISIEVMPQNIGAHFSLMEKLYANHVGLKHINQSDFDNMKSLKVLNLADNKLVIIPVDVFYKLEKLEVLYLRDNLILNLHIDLLAHSKALTGFFADYNQLEMIENMFANNSKLESIFLNNNKIKIIQANFASLKKIRNVDLRDNSRICTRCPLFNRNLRLKLNIPCEINKISETNAFHKEFQSCVISNLSGNETFEEDFAKCTSPLQIEPPRIDFDYKRCMELAHRDSVKIKQCEDDRTGEDEVLRDNFVACVESEISENLDAEYLLKNCMDEREFSIDLTAKNYKHCTFCPNDLDDNVVKMCQMRFLKGTKKSIEDFQKDVDELFGG